MALPLFATGINFFAGDRVWHLLNTDTGQVLDGDYEANSFRRAVSSNWATLNGPNQQKPVKSFVGGNADQFSLTVRLYRNNTFDSHVPTKLELLNAWCQRDVDLRRPPILLLTIGDGEELAWTGGALVILTSVDSDFDSPTLYGGVRGAVCNLTFEEYNEFSLENIPPPESRYARVKESEYMEMLAVREYGDPMLGDVLRKRHPGILIPEPGDVVKLPSLEAVQGQKIVPTSIALKTLTGRKNTAQKQLRQFHVDRLNRKAVSTIIPRGL